MSGSPAESALPLPRPPAESPFPDGVTAYAYADGASRGNPGPAAYGCVYAVEEGSLPLCGEGVALGEATNNVAEYRGAIAALQRMVDWGVTRAVLRLDSQLVVRQLDGSYRVKDAKLKQIHAEARELTARFQSLRFEHVPRKMNALADRMANHALDA